MSLSSPMAPIIVFTVFEVSNEVWASSTVSGVGISLGCRDLHVRGAIGKRSKRRTKRRIRNVSTIRNDRIWDDVTILPRTPQKSPQNNDAAKTHDLKRRAHDIARDSHGIEDEIRAMVSSYMAPKDDEDPELAIGRLVC